MVSEERGRREKERGVEEGGEARGEEEEREKKKYV